MTHRRYRKATATTAADDLNRDGCGISNALNIKAKAFTRFSAKISSSFPPGRRWSVLVMMSAIITANTTMKAHTSGLKRSRRMKSSSRILGFRYNGSLLIYG